MSESYHTDYTNYPAANMSVATLRRRCVSTFAMPDHGDSVIKCSKRSSTLVDSAAQTLAARILHAACPVTSALDLPMRCEFFG